MRISKTMAGTGLSALWTALSAGASTYTTQFSVAQGNDGWLDLAGAGVVDPSSGVPDRGFRIDDQGFGTFLYNESNPAFLGNYGASPSVTISTDIRLDGLTDLAGNPEIREWYVELYNSTKGATTRVSYNLGILDGGEFGLGFWRTLSVLIEDTTSVTLPRGWTGAGFTDPVTFEPRLPDGVTFADVLSGVDRIAFTTFQPEFGYPVSQYNIVVDNLSITRIPSAGGLWAAVIGLAAWGVRGRRR